MKKIVLISILILVILGIIFFPKEGGRFYEGSFNYGFPDYQSYCTCIGFKQIEEYSPDASSYFNKGFFFTCFGIPVNCRMGEFFENNPKKEFIEDTSLDYSDF